MSAVTSFVKPVDSFDFSQKSQGMTKSNIRYKRLSNQINEVQNLRLLDVASKVHKKGEELLSIKHWNALATAFITPVILYPIEKFSCLSEWSLFDFGGCVAFAKMGFNAALIGLNVLQKHVVEPLFIYIESRTINQEKAAFHANFDEQITDLFDHPENYTSLRKILISQMNNDEREELIFEIGLENYMKITKDLS